jgi:O-antigen/teichoic acid export membrane protein
MPTSSTETSTQLGSGPRVPDPSRVDPSIRSLRTHAARGTIINSLFNTGMYGLGTLQRILVAAWLTRTQYGFWGVLIAALVGLTWIKQLGVGDKYIQQSEPDQELAFQKAFTFELLLSLAFVAIVAIALPIYALAYGRTQLIVPGLVLATLVPLTAFESPAWIPYRRLQYGRQRILNSVDPVSTMVLSITLTVLGFGYWGLIAGAVAGSAIGAAVCVATSPYPLKLRMDRTTVKEYTSFGWPLVGFGLCGMITTQGIALTATHAIGFAGVGAIGLAGNITGMADGVDAMVSQAIYPVACAVAHRRKLLAEAFVKSNRVALMWGMPAMVGVALFAGDLVHYVLGDRWKAVIPVFVIVALTCGFDQVGFNWQVFLRAVNQTRPILYAALAQVVLTLAVVVPGIIFFGLMGYAVGIAVVALGQIVLRGYYMRRLFGDFSALRQLVRSVLPTIPPAALILLLRATAGGTRSPARAILELVTYGAATVAVTYLLERPLMRELFGYLRGARTGLFSGFRTASPAVGNLEV